MNLNKIILAIMLVAFLALSSIAQKLSPNKQLDEMIITGMKDWQIPGLAALVVKDGEVRSLLERSLILVTGMFIRL